MATNHPSQNHLPEPPSIPAPKKRLHKVSEAQLAANRANSQKSTGPRTESGKAVSSLNACGHGFTGQISALTEEDLIAQSEFTAPLIQDLNPATPVERQLAHSIAIGYWRLNRIRAAEDNIFALGHHRPPADLDTTHPDLHAALTQARAFLQSSKDLERLTLYEQRLHRTLAKDMAQLETLQTKRRTNRAQALEEAAQITRLARLNDTDPAAELEQTKTGSSPNGFVFSTSEIDRHLHRKHALEAAAYYDENGWDTPYPYPEAA